MNTMARHVAATPIRSHGASSGMSCDRADGSQCSVACEDEFCSSIDRSEVAGEADAAA